MSKRTYLALALFTLTLTIFATHVATAKHPPRAEATDQAFSMMFMSDAQFSWWRDKVDPACKDDDCVAQKGKETNQALINAMLLVQNLGSWPSNLTLGANSPIIKPQGVIINGDLTAYWQKNEADLYQTFYPGGLLPIAQYTLYPGLGNHDYSNNVHGDIDSAQIAADLLQGKDITGSTYDAVYYPDYNRSAKEAVWYMAALEERIPNLVNRDVTGYVKVENGGGFTARYTLEYDLSGQHTSQPSDEFTAGDSQSFVIPSRAENIHITIEENTGVLDSNFQSIWMVAGVFDSGRPRAFYYKVSGTTLNPQVEELPAPNQRPTGSGGSLAYSFDIGKYHFVQLQFRPNYKVDLPSVETSLHFESPGFKVTASYEWLHDDVTQAAAAGKYVVINMHDFNDSADNTDDPLFLSDFKKAITGGNVVAIFAGHIHQDYGKIGTLSVDDYEIPYFRSGSAECLKFLLAEFHERYFNVAVVDATDGQPAFVKAGDLCDARELYSDGLDVGYDSNNGDPVAHTYVINRKPVNLSATLNNSPAREGEALSFSASASDPDGDALTYIWRFGDGTTEIGENPTHTYADNGTYSVSVKADDGYTGTATYNFPVTVSNANPRARITSAPTDGIEGTQITLGSDVTDPGSVDTTHGFIYTWTVTKNNAAFASGAGSTLSFTPDDDGAYVVSLTATDKDRGSGTDTQRFDIKNANPTASITGAPTASAEGTQITLGSTATDPGSVDTTRGFTRSWQVTRNGSAFATGTGSTLSFTPDDNGSYVVAFSALDKDGGTGHAVKTITVVNVAPVGSLNSVGPLNEGDSGNVSFASAADPSTADAAAGFHYSFAGSTSGLATSYQSAGPANSASFNFPDNGTYIIYGRIFDKDGGATDSHTSVVVNNVAATAGVINISALGAVVAVNTPITASAAFNDPGTLDTHTAVWDWNVGSLTPDTSNGTVTESGGSGSITNTHTYTAAGVYPVKLTITDKDGAVSFTSFEYVVVYDRNEGFVTGGGWLNSPAGALSAHPALMGRVNFGFISRYHKADAPRGETHFHFHLGDFRFESRNYEWLIVQGGLAQYKGTGKINGKGGYTFLLTAADGQALGGDRLDRMRFRVWNTVTGAVVYDNMAGRPTTLTLSNVQAIGGGCIVVH